MKFYVSKETLDRKETTFAESTISDVGQQIQMQGLHESLKLSNRSNSLFQR